MLKFLPLVLVVLAACAPPLMKAARDGDVSGAQALLAGGADPNIRGGYLDGETPLMIAASAGHLPVVKVLIDKGARINEAGYRGETALMRAADHGRAEVVEYLVLHGAAAVAKGVQGSTALHYAAQGGRLDIAKAVLDHGADVNAPDSMTLGRTPLGIAAYFGDTEMARLLLERGADPRIPGSNGRTPDQQARWRGHFQLARLIKDASEGKPLTAAAAPAAPPPPSVADNPTARLPGNDQAFALVAGVRSSAGLPENPYAEHDAEAVRDHLKALGYPADHIIFLTGIAASRAGLVKNLETRLPAIAGDRSTVFFYFSGGASLDAKTGKAYLVPSDGDPEYLADTAYPLERLYEKLAGLRAGRVVAALECGLPGKTDSAVSGKLIVLSASRAGQPAGAVPDQGHGAFTYYLLRGLNGDGADKDGHVTVKSLFDYLSAGVRDAAKKSGREQDAQLLPDDSAEAARLRLR
ncbi:MAG: ankyrin repeat domain-containing protein [Elusimicrobia bacterium]|nr:ankyrin repeat domain-containing protein [Elusimicrobiota bacterium]